MGEFKSVCIIDDDHIFVYGVKRLIRETEFCENVIVFDNGQDAIEEISAMSQAGEKLPSLIFLDLNMPIMSGWEFLDDYLQLPGDDPGKTTVYIISSSVDPRDLVRIKNYPIIKNYILKPITADDLENILQEVA